MFRSCYYYQHRAGFVFIPRSSGINNFYDHSSLIKENTQRMSSGRGAIVGLTCRLKSFVVESRPTNPQRFHKNLFKQSYKLESFRASRKLRCGRKIKFMFGNKSLKRRRENSCQWLLLLGGQVFGIFLLEKLRKFIFLKVSLHVTYVRHAIFEVMSEFCNPQ